MIQRRMSRTQRDAVANWLPSAVEDEAFWCVNPECGILDPDPDPVMDHRWVQVWVAVPLNVIGTEDGEEA